jgi:hypothetical protein
MWERIFGSLRTPGKTFAQVSEQKLWKEGLLIVAIAALLQGLSSIAAAGNEGLLFYLDYLEQYLEMPAGDSLSLLTGSPASTIFSSLIGDLIGWVLMGAVFFLFAKLFKGQGTMSGMLGSLGYAASPYFIGAPLSALASLAGAAGYIISTVIGLATAIWVIVLQIIAIKESQRISTGAAVATYFVPAILLGILILLLIGVIVALIMTFTAA